MSGLYVAMAPCVICGVVFEFNAERVPSVPIDPSTGQPPDVGGTDRARAMKMPLCARCVEMVNTVKRERGLPEIEVLPGAYEAREESP